MYFFVNAEILKNVELGFFKFNSDNSFEKISIKEMDEAVFVVEGYVFNGSFEELGNKTDITLRTSIFSLNDFKACLCDESLNVSDIDNVEEVILSNAAHHKQFTNDVEIPWADLGLENSELKKEYDRLRTLSGYSLDDMSKFCIRHIYASTVGQELEDQRQLLMKLGKK